MTYVELNFWETDSGTGIMRLTRTASLATALKHR